MQTHEDVQNNINKIVCSVFDTSKATMICLSRPKRYETSTSFSKEPMKKKKVVLQRNEKAPPKEQYFLKHLSEEAFDGFFSFGFVFLLSLNYLMCVIHFEL